MSESSDSKNVVLPPQRGGTEVTSRGDISYDKLSKRLLPPHSVVRPALLQLTLHAYSDVVSRHLFDSIPKQIHRFLVNGVCDDFVNWMLNKVEKSDLQRWFAEDAISQRKRSELERTLSQFEEAILILESASSCSK